MKTSWQPTVHLRASKPVASYNRKSPACIPTTPSTGPRRRRPSPWLLATLLGSILIAPQSGAQVFHDAQRVTAVDLLVTYERDGAQQWATGSELPKKLVPEDFTVQLDGEPVEVVAVAPPDEARWHFLVYIDAELCSQETLIWATTRLGEHLDSLLAQGHVEIVIADPLPRSLLQSTDDRAEVERVLAQLALQSKATARLQQLRDEFLLHIAEQPADDRLLDLLATEELAMVAKRHDLLTTWLVDRSSAPLGEPIAALDRRALLYVSDGFDTDPAAFYDQFLTPNTDSDSDSDSDSDGNSDSATEGTDHAIGGDPAAVDETPVEVAKKVPARRHTDPSIPHPSRGLSQVLAAYGWVGLPMLPPEPELLTHGLRLGKFLIKPLRPYMSEADPDDSARADQHGLRGVFQRLNQLILLGVRVKYEEHRDVDKAEAYLELALALHGQDKLEDAAEAYEKALFHFSSDPRTADRQAVALAGVGDMLAELGERQAAQRAYDKALTLDPSLAEDIGTGIAFVDAARSLRPLADATVGQLLRGGRDLESFLASSPQKVRLTYQLEDLPRGTLQDVQVTSSRLTGRLLYPRWSRSGTPELVTEARLRQLLGAEPSLSALVDGEITGGDTAAPSLQANLDASGALTLTLNRPAAPSLPEAPESSQLPTAVRLSLASASEDGEIHITHRRLVLTDDPRQITPGDDLDLDDAAWVALVEDLESGSWQARMLDLR